MRFYKKEPGPQTWNEWFAWYPVRISATTWAWFETVWRRERPGGFWYDYEYRGMD